MSFLITARARRLLILFFFVVGLFVSLSSIKTSTPRAIDSLGNALQDYFYEEGDNSQFLKEYTNSNIDISDSKKFQDSVKSHRKYDDGFNNKFQEFYNDFMLLIESKRESILSELTHGPGQDHGIWTKDKLLKFVKMRTKDVTKARRIHQEIYNAIPSSFPKGLYKGNGIVLIGGGKFSWLSVLSIKSIRSFGSQLPIEVIIPIEKDYEHGLCEEILPALNSRCVLLYKVFDEQTMKGVHFAGYQYKSLALIASSFQNVLLLDSDNILVSNPDKYFESEPFTKTGMILWPDYWERRTSPHFMDIAGIQINEKLQVRQGKWDLVTPKEVEEAETVNYHDFEGSIPDISTESGQIFINKKTHIKTLLLSLFYNYYGPKFFYSLISQGSPGEGDKDTFIAGAVRGGESFYQVKSTIQAFGWFNSKKEFIGVGMGQKDPIEDYKQYTEILKKDDGLDGEEKFKDFDVNRAPVFTIHANFPKLDPYALYTEKKLVNDEGEDFRMYGNIHTFLPKLPKDKANENAEDKFDFELVQFRRMKFLLCDLNLSFRHFNDISRTELCAFIEGHIGYLEDNPV